MKTFHQFISEASLYEPKDSTKGSDVPLEVGKIGQDRSKGKYKTRKDIGKQRPRSNREQQPTRERGSASLSAKEAQKKAYRERKARESGAKTKSADELLRKKEAWNKTDPKYKPAKASGKSRQERDKIRRAGQKELTKIFKKQETDKYEKETGQKATGQALTKAHARAHQRMGTRE